MKFRQFVRDYFTFTRNERKGIVILLLIIFILAVANKMIFYFEKPAKLDEALFDSAKLELAQFSDSANLDIQNLKFAGSQVEQGSSPGNKRNAEKVESPITLASPTQLFKFDPNKCSDEDFLRLGFSNKQMEVIRKYIETGATFRNKEDFFKIKIITEKQKNTLASWIEISKSFPNKATTNETGKLVTIDINSVDSISLEQLPGIGKILSKRIIKYRELLGGFYCSEQLKEVYGLTDVTFSKIEKSIRIDKSAIHKIDLNFGDINDLSRHPYIKKNLAIKIIKFRSRYGNISDLAILRDSLILTNKEYLGIKPYY